MRQVGTGSLLYMFLLAGLCGACVLWGWCIVCRLTVWRGVSACSDGDAPRALGGAAVRGRPGGAVAGVRGAARGAGRQLPAAARRPR